MPPPGVCTLHHQMRTHFEYSEQMVHYLKKKQFCLPQFKYTLSSINMSLHYVRFIFWTHFFPFSNSDGRLIMQPLFNNGTTNGHVVIDIVRDMKTNVGTKLPPIVLDINNITIFTAQGMMWSTTSSHGSSSSIPSLLFHHLLSSLFQYSKVHRRLHHRWPYGRGMARIMIHSISHLPMGWTSLATQHFKWT